MTRRLARGIELLDEIVGRGPVANRGSRVTYNARIFLRRGDEVTPDTAMLPRLRGHAPTRAVDGVELIDHVTVLGKRRPIAGIERTLHGMRPGGFREVLIAAHLGYGERGLPGTIPANAVLRVRLWLREIDGDPAPPGPDVAPSRDRC